MSPDQNQEIGHSAPNADQDLSGGGDADNQAQGETTTGDEQSTTDTGGE